MKRKGFTLVELMVVVVIVIILAFLVVVSLRKVRARAREARVASELVDISKAVTAYAQDNNYSYPADTDRAVPPGLEKYLQGGVWPTSIYPRGVFDWENWTNPTGQQIYQISYRLCGLSDPISYCSDPVLFPKFTRNSSIYYCISDSTGAGCLPHRDYPNDPGYCINCKVHEINYTP